VEYLLKAAAYGRAWLYWLRRSSEEKGNSLVSYRDSFDYGLYRMRRIGLYEADKLQAVDDGSDEVETTSGKSF
jgi:hypothetical protein